jgi:prolipoprotein diacylglyceryl transferase
MNSTYAYIPSPSEGVWHLGPLPLRGYALCILLGIAVAIVISQRRWKARGGDPVVVIDIATWAVPFGVIGGRVYHVITTPDAYFGKGGDPVKVLYIWQGGLGIWGAVVLGGVGAWIASRRMGVKLPPFADAIAPGIVVAQAIGRVGNWFNNELYGKATSRPWGLKIYDWDSNTGRALHDDAGHAVLKGIYQPTFLYESIWDIFAAIVLILADRRWKLGHGRVFALYVVIYSVGRGGIETLRIDEADHILGLRLNVWTSIVVFVGGLTYLIVSAVLRPGRETELLRPGSGATTSVNAAADPADTTKSADQASGSEAATAAAGDDKDGDDKAAATKDADKKDADKKDTTGTKAGTGDSAEAGAGSGSSTTSGESKVGATADPTES